MLPAARTGLPVKVKIAAVKITQVQAYRVVQSIPELQPDPIDMRPPVGVKIRVNLKPRIIDDLLNP